MGSRSRLKQGGDAPMIAFECHSAHGVQVASLVWGFRTSHLKVPLWQVHCFELKATETFWAQENLLPPPPTLTTWKNLNGGLAHNKR